MKKGTIVRVKPNNEFGLKNLAGKVGYIEEIIGLEYCIQFPYEDSPHDFDKFSKQRIVKAEFLEEVKDAK